MKSNKYKIDKKVPIPDKDHWRKPKYDLPFSEMKCGHSIYVENVRPYNLCAGAYYWNKKNNKYWKWKAVSEGNGSRIWRME